MCVGKPIDLGDIGLAGGDLAREGAVGFKAKTNYPAYIFFFSAEKQNSEREKKVSSGRYKPATRDNSAEGRARGKEA